MAAEVEYMDRLTELMSEYGVQATCTCEICKKMCQRPCWPMPHEAMRMLRLGYADMFETYDWCGADGDIGVLEPRIVDTDQHDSRICVFQDPHTMGCRLHGTGLKPYEGRAAIHREEGYVKIRPTLRDMVAASWDTVSGRGVLAAWDRRMEDDDDGSS